MIDTKKVKSKTKKEVYDHPHSPFQKLISSALAQTWSIKFPSRRMSGKELAEIIKIDKSSLWIWLHSKNGYPSKRTMPPERLKLLSKALKLPVKDIQHSIDSSRVLYTTGEIPMPRASLDSFLEYIKVIKNDKRQNLSKKYVLNTARRFYVSANPHAPCP